MVQRSLETVSQFSPSRCITGLWLPRRSFASQAERAEVRLAPPARSEARLVKKFVRHFDRVARPEYGLTRPCYTNYSGSTRLRVIADQYRNRPTILRLPKMNTASRRPDRPQNLSGIRALARQLSWVRRFACRTPGLAGEQLALHLAFCDACRQAVPGYAGQGGGRDGTSAPPS